MNLPKRKTVAMVCAVFAGVMALLILCTSELDAQSGRYRVGLAPLLRVDAAPSSRWKVQSGINIVRDSGVGAAGNVVEFPVLPGYRVGIRYFSQRWWREAQAE